MNDESLRKALRALPRVAASPGFSAKVHAHVEQRAARIGWAPRLALGAAAALVLAAGGAWGLHVRRAHQDRELLSELNALRADQRRLETDLAALSKSAAPSEIVVDADDQVELVVGLRGQPRPADWRH